MVAHVWASFSLTLDNSAARPVGYREWQARQSTYASRTMAWSGPLLFLFIVYHLAHFTTGHAHPDFVRGDVHLFAVDSDPHEPDGIEASSKQAAWLERGLGASKAAWQIVYMHHPPYSSGSHGSSVELRWPYAKWGADLVLAGHDHHYERLVEEGIVYVVNGLGGNATYDIGPPIPGSLVRYRDRHGAQFIEASKSVLVSRFFTADKQTIDEFSLEAAPIKP